MNPVDSNKVNTERPLFTWLRRNHHHYLFAVDILSICLSAVASFDIRLETLFPSQIYDIVMIYLVLALVVRTTVMSLMGIYKYYWLYASARDLLRLWIALTISTIILAGLVLGIFFPLGIINSFPRSVLIIDWLVILVLIGGSRYLIRLLGSSSSARVSLSQKPRTRILIVGAGAAGSMIVRELDNNPQVGLDVVGFVDDNPAKLGVKIRGYPMLGSCADIARLVAKHHVEQVIIAMPTAPGSVIRRIRIACNEKGITVRTIPGIYEILTGQVSISQIRDVQIEDLLRREVVSGHKDSVAEFLYQKRVAVTGAGGSIGSELCRQIAAARPALLILMGHGENSIFQIEQELKYRFPNVPVVPIIVDIRDKNRLAWAFSRWEPEVLFHTAAHKHVPLMESNIAEAITNNVVGTRNVIYAAAEAGVEHLVMISTDKAVEPSSIMGASKSLAEQIVTQTAARTGRSYVVVRFGNVLGSRGSVVGVFKEQIKAGGPITITNPDMTRYFMSIPEAVQLVLEAGAPGGSDAILILDMGEPINILDMAKDLIELSGFTPYHDIDIVFTGARPGEKMHESLCAFYEELSPTSHEKIMSIKTKRPPIANLDEIIDRLDQLAAGQRDAEIRMLLQQILPDCELSIGH